MELASESGAGGASEEPPCAICGRHGAERRLHHMTHGVAVWLCRVHGSDDFFRRGDGAVFARRLSGMWAATGSLTRRRAAAVLAHVRQIRRAGAAAELPGSYSWRTLRTEAERRFAAGEDPRRVIAELRSRHAGEVARPPSVRTMRRWFTQARWLPASQQPQARRSPRARRWEPLPDYMLLPEFLLRHFPRVVPPSLLWDP